MPDLLLVCRDNKSCFELEELGKARGFRVKYTFECSTAEEWLKTHPFDVVFVDVRVPIEKQQEIAARLWQANALAPFVVFDLEPDSDLTMREARLFGAEVARGVDAKDSLAQSLERYVKSEGARKNIQAADVGVMVVEDLDSPRDIICMFIESLGYPKVKGFSSAKEALAELKANPKEYSCVVTDIRMPEMSGKDLIDFVRSSAELQQLPVVVLTAYGTVDTLIDCLRAGATGFLIKPPRKNDLKWELARALRILAHKFNPRLASADEVESMRDLLIDKGFM